MPFGYFARFELDEPSLEEFLDGLAPRSRVLLALAMSASVVPGIESHNSQRRR